MDRLPHIFPQPMPPASPLNQSHSLCSPGSLALTYFSLTPALSLPLQVISVSHQASPTRSQVLGTPKALPGPSSSWTPIPAQLLTSWVTSGMCLNLSEPQVSSSVRGLTELI